MNLISSLNSGFLGAANGWAELYVRGTSARATWFPDFQASSGNSSGANITLDAYGSAEVYVNQLVDVVVKDASGNLVRSYTDGYEAPNVEALSQSFTGIDYVTGVSGASSPTTLQAILDLWKTNSGAIDWKVLVSGAAVNLQVALGSLNGLVFNVKNPLYGAIGDGVANDQSAIAAALAAAVAAGGGIVFFPKGTYLITTAIEWDHRVSILGVGARDSIITSNSASNARILTWTSGSVQGDPIWIAGMAFSASQANTGEQLYASVPVNIVIDRCGFGTSANATGVGISVSGAYHLRVLNSRFSVNGAAGTAVTLSTTGKVLFSDCYFDTLNTAYGGSFLKATGWVTVSSCDFDQSFNVTGLTVVGVEIMDAADIVTIRDSRFVAAAQSFAPACIKLKAGAYVTTQGNDFGGTFPQFRYSTIATPLANGSKLELGGVIRTTSAATSFTVTDAYETAEYWLTGTVATFTAPTMFFPGQKLFLLVNNQSAGNWGNTTLNGFSKYGTVDTSALIGHIVVVEAIVSTIPASGGVTYSWVAVMAKGDSL